MGSDDARTAIAQAVAGWPAPERDRLLAAVDKMAAHTDVRRRAGVLGRGPGRCPRGRRPAACGRGRPVRPDGPRGPRRPTTPAGSWRTSSRPAGSPRWPRPSGTWTPARIPARPAPRGGARPTGRSGPAGPGAGRSSTGDAAACSAASRRSTEARRRPGSGRPGVRGGRGRRRAREVRPGSRTEWWDTTVHRSPWGAATPSRPRRAEAPPEERSSATGRRPLGVRPPGRRPGPSDPTWWWSTSPSRSRSASGPARTAAWSRARAVLQVGETVELDVVLLHDPTSIEVTGGPRATDHRDRPAPFPA